MVHLHETSGKATIQTAAEGIIISIPSANHDTMPKEGA